MIHISQDTALLYILIDHDSTSDTVPRRAAIFRFIEDFLIQHPNVAVVLGSGSTRQTNLIDILNFRENKNGLHFVTLNNMFDNLSREWSSRVTLSTVLLGDLEHGETEGNTFTRGLHMSDDKIKAVCYRIDEYGLSSISWQDSEKHALIYFQTHYIANKHPHKKISVILIDDQGPILESLTGWYKKNPGLLPCNVTFHGMKMVNEKMIFFSTVDGCGKGDPNYHRTVRYNHDPVMFMLSRLPESVEDVFALCQRHSFSAICQTVSRLPDRQLQSDAYGIILHYAISQNMLASVDSLTKYPVSMRTKYQGLTPIQAACKKNAWEIVEIFSNFFSDQKDEARYGDALVYALEAGRIPLAIALQLCIATQDLFQYIASDTHSMVRICFSIFQKKYDALENNFRQKTADLEKNDISHITELVMTYSDKTALSVLWQFPQAQPAIVEACIKNEKWDWLEHLFSITLPESSMPSGIMSLCEVIHSLNIIVPLQYFHVARHLIASLAKVEMVMHGHLLEMLNEVIATKNMKCRFTKKFLQAQANHLAALAPQSTVSQQCSQLLSQISVLTDAQLTQEILMTLKIFYILFSKNKADDIGNAAGELFFLAIFSTPDAEKLLPTLAIDKQNKSVCELTQEYYRLYQVHQLILFSRTGVGYGTHALSFVLNLLPECASKNSTHKEIQRYMELTSPVLSINENIFSSRIQAHIYKSYKEDQTSTAFSALRLAMLVVDSDNDEGVLSVLQRFQDAFQPVLRDSDDQRKIMSCLFCDLPSHATFLKELRIMLDQKQKKEFTRGQRYSACLD